MSMDIMSDDDQTKKKKAGIKHPSFTSSGNNGQSHRANAVKKKRQHLENMKRRSEHYASMQGEKGWRAGSTDCMNWHSVLNAISKGTA